MTEMNYIYERSLTLSTPPIGQKQENQLPPPTVHSLKGEVAVADVRLLKFRGPQQQLLSTLGAMTDAIRTPVQRAPVHRPAVHVHRRDLRRPQAALMDRAGNLGVTGFHFLPG